MVIGQTTRAAPAKAPLTREAIVDAAMAILDADGTRRGQHALGRRRLGTGPASLYAHVSGKDELMALMLDRVIGEVTGPAARPRALAGAAATRRWSRCTAC